MLAAIWGCMKDLPKEFYHDPTLKDNDGWTVAMYAAVYECINDLPKEFYHDISIKNK